MDASMKCIKYMLFASNLIFTIIGFLLISIGSTINSIYEDFETFVASYHFSPAVLLVAAGVIIFLVALFGCLGAIKESTLFVNLYALLLFFVLLMEIGVAIAALMMRKDIVMTVEDNMKLSMSLYGKDDATTSTWDFAQTRLMCCGVHQISDWSAYNITGTSVSEINLNNYTVPNSCCVYGDCTRLFESGCFDRLAYIVSECSFMLGSGAICVALVQSLGIIFAHMLAKAIRQAKTKRELQRQFQKDKFFKQVLRGEEEEMSPYSSKSFIN